MPSPDDEIRKRTFETVAAYQTLLTQQRWAEWINLWAEDGILDFPYAPAGRTSRYVGHNDILAYMSGTPGKVTIDAVETMHLMPMQNPAMAVVELSIRGHATQSGLPYNQSYVIFFEMHDGKIAHYREYWNPLISMDAFGGRDIWTASFGSGSREAQR